MVGDNGAIETPDWDIRHLLTITWDGDERRVYIDGNPIPPNVILGDN